MNRTPTVRALLFSTTVALFGVASTVSSLASEPTFTDHPGGAGVQFNRDIRPLLSDRCFKCHGFDEKARQGDLRLDTWEGLTSPRSAGFPVVPGDASHSTLVDRVNASDPARRMPPSDSGLSLTDEERERLSRWIDGGGSFERHWGFVKPTDPSLPDVDHAAWPRTELDRFILANLERHDVSPSPDADRETLLRRVSLDLTGLPPTPEEIDQFLIDNRADAYERVVDRLLDSPRFGERMALVWLDAARYADTNGFHHDNIRTVWPYRDWVIRAFQRNMPYDQFVIEQLAGDLLPDATTDQRIASAFCRMHNINDEGGALDAEYRVEAVADRIETIATTFMGLTFTCARCHDHKYDPITQDDYYSLFSYFNSVDERGVYGADFEAARAYPARISYRTPELEGKIAKAESRLVDARDRLAAATPTIASELTTWESTFRADRGIEWVDAKVVDATTESGATLVPQPDGSFLVKGTTPATDVHRFVFDLPPGNDLRLLRFDALLDASLPNQSLGLAPNGNAVVSSIRLLVAPRNEFDRVVTSEREVEFAWAWADHEQPNGDYDIDNVLDRDRLGWALNGHASDKASRVGLLMARAPFGYVEGTRAEVVVEYRSIYSEHIVGRPRLSFARGVGLEVSDFPVVASDWWSAGPFQGEDFAQLFRHRFGPEEVTSIVPGAKFAGGEWRHRPDVVDGVVASLRGETSAFYFGRSLRTPVARELDLSLGSDDAIQVYLNGQEVLGNEALRGAAPDQDRVRVMLPAGESALVMKVTNSLGPAGFYAMPTPVGDAPSSVQPIAMLAPSDRDESQQARLFDDFGRAHSPTFATLDGEVTRLEAGFAALEAEAVPVLVMQELAEPTSTFVLDRGNYGTPNRDRPVTRRPPALFDLPFPAGAPNDRLGFAQWLVSGDHPLTSRVHVNRLWQMLFGVGIVETTEDFGRQASWPSHLDLLDWLSEWFEGTGWDQKRLLRLIVTSSTYRQSARLREDVALQDPGNRWLSWFPRRRLPGELIRDQALFAAGLLVERVGGASVRPYQPAGLWQELSIGGSSNTQTFAADEGDALYRRSLYTFWKRTSPSPQMTTFDAPTREFCVVRRSATNTPLQALVLWNDVQFVEASRSLAARTLAEAGSAEARIATMFRRATGRRPGAREVELLTQLLLQFVERYRTDVDSARQLLAVGDTPVPMQGDVGELAAWTMVANAIFSLDETIVRD